MITSMDKLIQTFLDLADIDEVHPNENRVLSYIKDRLAAAAVPFVKQDTAGNIVARIDGQNPEEVIALSGHVDIAAPLQGRKVINDGDIIKTDGTSLLGGDDKTAVAAMLELADFLKNQPDKPSKTVEFIFSVGEEAGLKGASALDFNLVRAKQVLVFDWLGSINHIVTQSPSFYAVDVVYKGKDAHPAQWQQGKNAGAALMRVATSLQQGQYLPEVIFNIGIVKIGNARNKVPGHAELKAEIRSFDKHKVEVAAREIEATFQDGAKQSGIDATVSVNCENDVYLLNKQGSLLAAVTSSLKAMQLEPVFESTYGCFDGNIFAANGLDVVIMGAAYYNPHSPDEYVKKSELAQMLAFLQNFISQ